MGEPVIDWKLPTDQGRRDLERVRGRLERAGISPGERGYDEQALNDATVRLGYRCKCGTEGGAWLATVSGSFPGSGGPFQQTCWGWSLRGRVGEGARLGPPVASSCPLAPTAVPVAAGASPPTCSRRTRSTGRGSPATERDECGQIRPAMNPGAGAARLVVGPVSRRTGAHGVTTSKRHPVADEIVRAFPESAGQQPYDEFVRRAAGLAAVEEPSFGACPVCGGHGLVYAVGREGPYIACDADRVAWSAGSVFSTCPDQGWDACERDWTANREKLRDYRVIELREATRRRPAGRARPVTAVACGAAEPRPPLPAPERRPPMTSDRVSPTLLECIATNVRGIRLAAEQRLRDAYVLESFAAMAGEFPAGTPLAEVAGALRASGRLTREELDIVDTTLVRACYGDPLGAAPTRPVDALPFGRRAVALGDVGGFDDRPL